MYGYETLSISIYNSSSIFYWISLKDKIMLGKVQFEKQEHYKSGIFFPLNIFIYLTVLITCIHQNFLFHLYEQIVLFIVTWLIFKNIYTHI